ncbi:MAG: hypothetical protein H6742_17145 [Alphaproteobacteria bacterium]|nr:hypothetical protein [Alphaproteobacteria bacterium]
MPSGALPDESEAQRAARYAEARGYLATAVDRLRRANERGRLYGLSHPEAQAAIDDAWGPLNGALELVHPLKVHASLDGTIWEGDLLVPEDDDKPGLGRLLHREGIQTVAFHQGMTRDELVGLLGVLRLNLGLPQYEEETLDSLLWQADLPHVRTRPWPRSCAPRRSPATPSAS